MTHRTILILALLLAALGCNKVDTDPGPVVSGPWLGCEAPTDGPALFAPGIVNRGLACRDLAASPDGDELIWTEQVGGFQRSVILRSRLVNGAWTEPETLPFSGDPRWLDIEPAFAPDGNRLYFASNRPASGDGEAEDHHSLWMVERPDGDWGAPTRLPDALNDGDVFFPSPTRDGSLYFTRNEAGGISTILVARPDDEGGWLAPEVLPEQVNAGRTRFNATADPDDRFLIVPIFGLPESLGGVDYYRVDHLADGSWADPAHLGDLVNSPSRQEWSFSFSPDMSLVFFMSDRPDTALAVGRLTPKRLRTLHNAPGTGQTGIWWMPARLLPGLSDNSDLTG